MPQAALCLHCMHDNWVYTSQHCMHHEQQADMFNRLIGADVPLQLSEWGLRPETAVGCALDYLFRPREEVLDLVRDSYEALQDTSALKIGTQVWCMGQNCRMPSWLISSLCVQILHLCITSAEPDSCAANATGASLPQQILCSSCLNGALAGLMHTPCVPDLASMLYRSGWGTSG